MNPISFLDEREGEKPKKRVRSTRKPMTRKQLTNQTNKPIQAGKAHPPQETKSSNPGTQTLPTIPKDSRRIGRIQRRISIRHDPSPQHRPYIMKVAFFPLRISSGTMGKENEVLVAATKVVDAGRGHGGDGVEFLGDATAVCV